MGIDSVLVQPENSKSGPSEVQKLVDAVRACKQFAEEMFDELREGSAVGSGVTRDAYGYGEQFAHELMVRHARELNLEISQDAARNTYATLPGRNRSDKSVVIGSHLDSVANGGNFDGAAGVVSGLVAIRALQAIGFQPSCDVTVMAVRAEESVWFEQSYVGSRSALGALSPRALDALRIDTKRSLANHIRGAGGDPDALRRGEAFLDKERVRAFLEVHIEQAPALVDANCPIGIVTGIPGNFRYPNVRVTGEYGHVGLYRKFRRDAALGAAELAMHLDRTWADWESKGRPMAFTIGRFHTNAENDALTKVAGECTFSLDVRAYNEEDILELHASMDEAAKRIEKDRGVKFDFGDQKRAEAAEINREFMADLARIADELKLPFLSMSSPASHDAAAFSVAGIPVGMIFIRNENGSHNPDEAMEIGDFLDATSVLGCWLQKTLS